MLKMPISKAFKGFGKLYFGNAKSAGGMWENTSSNSILFMERPMYNEAANLAIELVCTMIHLVQWDHFI